MRLYLCIILLFGIVCSSCIADVPCGRAFLNINMISFPNSETDEMIIKKFIKGSGFATTVQTFTINRNNSWYYQRPGDTLEIGNVFGNDGGLTSDFDYELNIPTTGVVYRISDIEEKKNSRKWTLKKVYCLNNITSYKLNNQITTGTDLFTLYIIK